MAITTRTATTDPTLDSAALPVTPKAQSDSKDANDRRNRRIAFVAVSGFAALAVAGTAAGLVLATRSPAPPPQPTPTVAGPTTTLTDDAAESAHGAGQGVRFFSGSNPSTASESSGPNTGAESTPGAGAWTRAVAEAAPAAASAYDVDVAHGGGAWVRSTHGSTVR